MPIQRFPIEASHIKMFAASIADENPIYHDEEKARATEPGSIIAPPTFAQASAQFDDTYFLRPKPGKPWMGSGRTPSGTAGQASSGQSTGMGARGLHPEQHFEYHRHLKPGDVLTAEMKQGKSWEKEGKRSGKLKFSEAITEYRDQNGELVITARSVGVETERAVDNS